MASHPLTITDEEIRSHFPEDQALANEMATEMIRAILIRRDEPANMRLENRPDWQAALHQGIKEVKTGNVVSHEDHLNWKRQRQ